MDPSNSGRLIVLAGCALLLGVMPGCQTTKRPDYTTMVPRFYVESNPREGYSEVMTLPISRVKVPVDPDLAFSELDVTQVELVQVDMGKCLSFSLTPAASRDLYRLSVSNLGRRLVLTINGVPLGVRVMEAPLSLGNIMIFLEVSDEELEAMVPDLQATVVEVQEAVEKG